MVVKDYKDCKASKIYENLLPPWIWKLYFSRLHLKELGHPIVYDTLYGSETMVSFPTKEFKSNLYIEYKFL